MRFLGLALFVAALTSSIWLLHTIHFRILIPACTLPLIQSSDFCRSVCVSGLCADAQNGGNNPGSVRLRSLFCNLPLVSCSSRLELETASTAVSETLYHQFEGLSELFKLSQPAPRVVHDVTNLRMAIDDLVTLVRLSEIQNKEAIIVLLEGIIDAGVTSSRYLLAYTEDLEASITIILATANATLEAIGSESPSLWQFICEAMPFGLCVHAATGAFLHTLHIFELLIHDLTHSNALTGQSLITLESKITALKRLVDDEANAVSAEIGELLGRLWTVLGGNRGHLEHAKSRYRVLNQTGQQAKAMKKMVLDVQLELEGLQKNCDRLRSYAATPLLLLSATPKKAVVISLSEGCKQLKSRVKTTMTRGAFEDSGTSGPSVAIGIPMLSGK